MLRMFLMVMSLGITASAAAQSYTVDPEAGRNTFSAVFDAPLGERIMADSSAVGCNFKLTGLIAGGHCAVALTSIKVDADATKTEHFEQWSTNKKVAPDKCEYALDFDAVKLSAPLAEGQRVPFTGPVKVTVCGRHRDDGGSETVNGTATVLPDGLLKIRAEIKGFNRESYGVSPKNTAGWLARVQQLAPVVNATGDIEVNVFATQVK